MTHLLSKSKYIRGLQCDRALWLDVHQPRLARYTAEQMRRFDRGRDFEYAFKSTFPHGIDISAELKRNVDAYPERTAQLLDKGDGAVLFEAGFQYDDVLVLADVVQQREDGTLDIYEVKSGTALSETYRRDAALQHYVISHCRSVNKFYIVHAANKPEGLTDYRQGCEPLPQDKQSVEPRRGAPSGLPSGGDCNAGAHTPACDGTSPSGTIASEAPFVTIDLTEELAAQHAEIEQNIAAMKDIIRGGEPDTPTGQHCLEPYACPYQHYCAQGVRQMSLF